MGYRALKSWKLLWISQREPREATELYRAGTYLRWANYCEYGQIRGGAAAIKNLGPTIMQLHLRQTAYLTTSIIMQY